MTTTEPLPQLPFTPGATVLDVPPAYRQLLADRRITKVRTTLGDVAWIATRYDDVKALFADPRLGRSHPEPEKAAKISASAVLGGASGDYETEQRDHTRMRRLLTPAFSARRMNGLRPRVKGLVSDLLERMAAAGPPANLHESLSFPLPVLVICELLGVPYEDRERFRKWSGEVSNLLDEQLAQAALAEFYGYMVELIGRKRDDLGEDVISDLIRAEDEWQVGVEETAALSVGLLFAGHETTMTRIDMGTTLLLSNPDQAARLRSDASLLPTAVEEILRLSGAGGGGGGIPRYAHADIEIGGITIKAGEAVLLPPGVANHDESAFDDPDTFDITRKGGTPHLAFGHGAHFCIGASLARIELQEVFAQLLTRFPSLRLAVPVEELQLRTNTLTGGLQALPVTW
ncbi:cytochrome P450 [Fodinicola acaciae]|uniref:cytochrome P450 n=1 Tax=Fodinicola acaciae TaxID=2681555 RepID=UPI0013D5A731|nr:cytochrome P450 [Fodinicola acaciae]